MFYIQTHFSTLNGANAPKTYVTDARGGGREFLIPYSLYVRISVIIFNLMEIFLLKVGGKK